MCGEQQTIEGGLVNHFSYYLPSLNIVGTFVKTDSRRLLTVTHNGSRDSIVYTYHATGAAEIAEDKHI